MKRTGHFFLKSSFAVCLGLLSVNVLANKIDFAGFASFVYSKTISDDSRHGALYSMSNDGDMRDLSLLGLRINTSTEQYGLSFTAQAVMYGRDDYKPEFDWAYATIDLGKGWDISLGRTRTPLFMYSSYQDVAYAYPWIKPPYSVYGIPQFKSVDGLKLRNQTTFGDWASDLQIWYGMTRERLTENDLDTDLELDNNTGVAWAVEREWLTLRAVYMQAKTSVDVRTNPQLDTLLQGIDSLVTEPTFPATVQQQFSELRQRMEWEDSKAQFYGLGAGLDFGHVFFVTEATLIDIDENIASPETMQSYYAVIGTRIVPKWTFSLTVNHDRDREHTELVDAYNSAMNQIGGPPAGFPTGAEFEETVIKRYQRFDNTGFTVTARWDFHRSAAAKLEYLQEEREFGNNGTKLRPKAVRLGVDLVF